MKEPGPAAEERARSGRPPRREELPAVSPRAAALLTLQRAIGNRAAARLLRRTRDPKAVREAAADGVRTPAQALPHRDRIQASFGGHDVSGVRAHVGPAASASAQAAGARAFAAGEDVVFGGDTRLETAAHEAAHVVQQRSGVDLADGVGRTGDRYERQAEAVAAAVAAGQSAEELLGPVAPAGGATAARAVQLLDYGDPTHADIKDAMTAAGIAAFGPFVWDSDVPRFKLNPAYAAWTIDDCVNAARYEPETKAVAGEKGAKHGLIVARRRAALQAVFGVTQGVVEKIVAVDGGRTPRAFVDLATEDAAGGGHSAQRHILGQGLMPGHRQVALRAAFWKVAGVRMDLDAAGTASVFANDAGATAAVQAALATVFSVANWPTARKHLALGTQIAQAVPVATPVIAYTKRDAPVGDPYDEAETPKYIDATKNGTRELFAGDYTAGEPNPPDAAKPTLTHGGPANWGNVYVVIDPNADVNGGWVIRTAYPKP